VGKEIALRRDKVKKIHVAITEFLLRKFLKWEYALICIAVGLLWEIEISSPVYRAPQY